MKLQKPYKQQLVRTINKDMPFSRLLLNSRDFDYMYMLLEEFLQFLNGIYTL